MNQQETQAATGAQAHNPPPATTKTALFAGGCFWCMEPPFDNTAGVLQTVPGYTGGTIKNPTYKQVTAGGTGHLEAIQIHYDPSIVSYQELLDIYWRNIDFLDNGGQFCDRGPSYTPAIFVLNSEQKALAESSREALRALFPGLNTPVREAQRFYPAEDYHQNYYQKKPVRYKYYRWSCRRDVRLQELARLRREKEQAAAGVAPE